MSVDQDTLNAVSALLDQKLAMANPTTSAGVGFGQLGGAQSAPQPFAPNGISIRLKIPLPDGSTISPQLNFGPEHCQNPQDIMALINALQSQGYPLDIYTPRNQGNGGGWGGNQGGGGGYQGGGGYNRGGGGFNRGGGGNRW